MTRAEFQILHDRFRDARHTVNNTLGVLMALSELAQRNPSHYDKLAKTVLTRGPELVEILKDFQDALAANLNAPAL